MQKEKNRTPERKKNYATRDPKITPYEWKKLEILNRAMQKEKNRAPKGKKIAPPEIKPCSSCLGLHRANQPIE